MLIYCGKSFFFEYYDFILALKLGDNLIWCGIPCMVFHLCKNVKTPFIGIFLNEKRSLRKKCENPFIDQMHAIQYPDQV